jgi:hypothetical protein
VGGRSTTAVVILLLACASVHVSAQNSGDRDAEIAARLQFVEHALDAGRKSADRWWYGWLAAYGAAGIVQTSFAVTVEDSHQQQDLAIGALTSFVGAAGQFVFPLQAGRFARTLRTMPEGTADERRAKLAKGEAFLEKAAEQEAFGRSWKSQASSLAVNGGAGLATSLLFDRPARDGLITFAIGQAVSELQYFTQPLKAVRDLAAYRRQRGALGGTPLSRARPSWSFSLSASHFSASLVF